MCRQLEKHGIPCTIVLDSAVAYIMDKVDVCLVGSEAVVESGGLINSVGSYQMAMLAKVANKPFYAMAERCANVFPRLTATSQLHEHSYKFHRLFPLSQFDLPTHTEETLSIKFIGKPDHREPTPTSSPRVVAGMHKSFPDQSQYHMSREEIEKNPDVDYTKYCFLAMGKAVFLTLMFSGLS